MSVRKTKQLARFIQYVIGRYPDEFGLVTDEQGYTPVSDLLKVLQEEGWHQVRRNHLETLPYHIEKPFLEIKGHLVRVTDRSQLDGLRETTTSPKLVYAPIRRRAYETVSQHGLRPQGHAGQVVLFADLQLADKVGRRRDTAPVIVTVQVESALRRGHVFRQFGERIYLTESVPVECCQLPRPPQTTKKDLQERPSVPPAPKTPGSFAIDLEPLVDHSYPGKSHDRARRSKVLKKERQKARRLKNSRNYPR